MRALARWGITPLLAAPAGAWALGLGDIELQSALNQPFRAEISLSATPDELQTLRINVADAATFERYGLDRPSFLTTFEFRVVTSRDGRSTIEVTSRDSIAEPFVEVLLEAVWPRGRSLKVYTVFLDPPVLLPAPAAPPVLTPAETRTSGGAAPGGQINRPAPAPAAEPPAPAPAPAVTEPNVSRATPTPRATPTAPRAPVSDEGGVYGPVQRGETLSRIADRVRPEGVTINQMMIAIFEANPQAFSGNINVLRAGATLRLPDSTSLGELAVTTANAEVRRQIDEWRERTAQGGQLRLLPPADTEVARAPTPVAEPTRPAVPTPAPVSPPAAGGAADAATAAGLDESRRLLELRNQELQNLQQQAEAADEPAAETQPPAAEPGVDLESEQLFADETEPPALEPEAEAEVPAPAPAPAATATPTPAATGPSLVSQALDWLRSPVALIAIGVAVLLLIGLWFVRRRRTDTEDVTGRWEALESETDDQTRDATERMRSHTPEQTIVVEEQHAASLRPAAEAEPAPRRAASPRPQAQSGRSAPSADETLSSQTVINLDQADAVAEADFHIAYGLYDQAAELVQKALEAAPDRRDLKLKLLEVYFMWGNKDAFLKAAQALRADSGQGDDPDWNKVVIMGRQICPDERMFTEGTTGGGRVDVDLEAGGDAPLDLAFDEVAAATTGTPSGSSGLDFNLETSDERPAPKSSAKSSKPPRRDFQDSSLDIGSKTAAGLEAALFEGSDDDEDTGKRTTPDLPADALAITQESPTIERPGHSDWATAENMQLAADAPTMETPTIESPAARSASTISTKTVAIPRRGGDSPTVQQAALASAAPTEYTAEIDLDDLGLDVKDLEGLPGDLGDLPMAAGRDTDTREQPALREDDALLSATGVTKVLHNDDDDSLAANTSVLEDQDATMMATGFADEGTSTMTGTAVLDDRHALDAESGNTSLVKSLGKKKGGGVDLNLDDLTAALHGADTVEQPRANAFSRDVFGGGDTPVDLDIGADVSADDDPTGTEEAGLDPQTMTEVGTKLDLARAYIDMGDPEGARSILEEVLDEGDNSQKREAQGLIDALSA
jgi:pilus assembly protein FimV